MLVSLSRESTTLACRTYDRAAQVAKAAPFAAGIEDPVRKMTGGHFSNRQTAVRPRRGLCFIVSAFLPLLGCLAASDSRAAEPPAPAPPAQQPAPAAEKPPEPVQPPGLPPKVITEPAQPQRLSPREEPAQPLSA